MIGHLSNRPFRLRLVDAPDIGFTWQGAGGMADAEVIEQLNGPDDELYGEMIAIRQQLNHTNTPQTPHFWKATALVP
ncbi:MAG: hypothetical protein DWQ04_07325 [Chloroflexi bacterium]|nr:MAG: hypothetical protein DWQ04_07325 [Chloroflexota bacterium]